MFLSITLVVGIGIDFYKTNFTQDKFPTFTDEKYDSIFTSRSKTFSKLSEKNLTDDSNRTIININTATKEELILLPGVGEETADRILIFRKEEGLFKDAKDLKKLKASAIKTCKNDSKNKI